MLPFHPLSLRTIRHIVLFLAVVLFVVPLSAQQPDRDAPETELASFRLPPGFEIHLYASERDGLVKPIQMRWDPSGRLWVIGSTTYPQIKPGEEPNDKVWILEDTKGGGYADKVTVFADGLVIPTGLEIAPVGNLAINNEHLAFGKNAAAPTGGEKATREAPSTQMLNAKSSMLNAPSACYVGEGTKLLLLTDTDGDGKADKREVVLRGFGTGDNHQNINSFRWTPGGELVFCQGLHAFSRVETPYGIVALDQAGLWRFRPREHRLDAFFGGAADPQNPWGWTFSKWGVPVISAGNSGNMYFPSPEMIRGWQGGRRETIWATGKGRKTSNPEIIESAHFPDEWQGALVTGGYINNGVWTLAMEPDGAGVKMVDHPALPPLVQSTHGSFRPVDVKLGPDGALYICDWYNPIIGHYQASFRHPDRDKTHGRIWRVTYKGRPLLTPPPVLVGRVSPRAESGAASEPAREDTRPTPDFVSLFELLRSKDRYPREQAKMKLWSSDPAAVTRALRNWYPQLDPVAPDLDFAHVQALGVFEGLEVVDVPLLKRTLAAKSPEARAYAAATLARWADRLPVEFETVETLADLAHDADPRVRLAAVVAAGNVPRPESMVVVLSAAQQPRDKFIDTALTAATTVLKPQWEPLVAKGAPGWKPEWLALVKTLDKPAPKAAPAKKVAQQVGAPIVPIYGRLRASPFVVGSLVEEVKKQGNVENGRKIFHRPELACLTCHRIGEEGGKIGPALDAIGSAQPLEFIIGTVIEPQREVKEGFETVRVTTKKNEELIGVIVAGNDREITLRDPTGAEHMVSQADIAKREFIGSLMPAGLTDSLPPEDLRDLFAYLTQLGKVK
jgi:putative heme-binding domain-containing protein